MTYLKSKKYVFFVAVFLLIVTGCSKNEPSNNDVRTANEPPVKTNIETNDLKAEETTAMDTNNAVAEETTAMDTNNAVAEETKAMDANNAKAEETTAMDTNNAVAKETKATDTNNVKAKETKAPDTNNVKAEETKAWDANMNTQNVPLTPKEDPGINRVPFEAFALQDFNGKTVSLKDFRGKVVVLNFWASWCPPCRAEMPELQSLHEAFAKDEKAVLVGINLADGYRETKQKAEAFLNSEGLTFLNLVDEGQRLAGTLNIFSIPTTYILDTEGRIVDTILGQTTKEKLMNIVSSLI